MKGRKSLRITIRTDIDNRTDAMELKEWNDCSVRALKHALEITYPQAKVMLSNAGREDGKGILTHKLTDMLLNTLRCEDVSQWFYQCTLHNALPRMHKDFVFLVYVPNHVFCVKNGRIQDSFVNANCYVEKVFQVNPKQSK